MAAAVMAMAGLSANAMGESLRAVATAASVQLHTPPRPASTRANTTPFRHGLVLVGFRAGVAARERAAIERAAGAIGSRRLGPAINPSGRGRVAGEDFLAPFALQVPEGHELAVVGRLRHDPAVAYAEPDYLLSASATPKDPSFLLQWGASNTGQLVPLQEITELLLGGTGGGTAGADDSALKAWQVSTGSRSIVIGETDTGVDYTHPDLGANVWTNPGGIGGCQKGTRGYDVLTKLCEPMDEDTAYGGHGTHVAGILGAVGNNGIGVTGMNWQTSILPVKWMNTAAYGETGALIEALQWLVAAKQAGVNIRVDNNSDTFFGTAYSQALSNEIDVLGANGILFVASAGNTGNNNDEVSVQRYPCSYDRPTEICVAATNNKDELPSWANYGPHTVDLAAPGASIYSTLRGGAYGYLSGSSMAAPQVAGAAALILSAAPSLSTTALKADILEHVDHLPSLAGKLITGGRLDVCKALPGCASVAPQPPVNVSPPTIGGAAALSKTLVETNGSWTSAPTAFAYQWLRCDTKGGSCVAIAGAHSQTYVPASSDVGRTLRVQETASNVGGPGAPARSAASAPVVPATPVNSGKPSISGQAIVGQVLSASTGNWNGYPTSFAYQWQRCNAQGNSCTAIALATTSGYTAVEADAGNTLRVAVTATNAIGASAPASSNQTAVVKVVNSTQPPVNTGRPSVSGTASVGRTLSASTGSWSGYPTSYAYQWQRCDSKGNNCAAIAGATEAGYSLAEADAAKTVRVSVTASNSSGSSAPASSNQSPVVNWQPPASTGLPVVSGAALSGQTLTASTGTWSGHPTTYAYQWQRCDSSGGGCKALSATASTYAAGAADVGSTLRVVVTASNPAGQQSATSNATEVVRASAQPPVNSYPPAITGSSRVGQALSVVRGTWTNEPTGYAYQWFRCDASGNGCAAVSGATGQSYVTSAADSGHTIVVQETASNASGAGSPAASAATAVISPPPPTNTAPPSISGTPRRGQILKEAHGSWTNEPAGYAYQWLQCNSTGANCTTIAGAASQAYVPTAGDVGHTIEVKEIASNGSGSSAPATSSATALVTEGTTSTFGKTTVGALSDGGLFSNYKIVHTESLSAPGAVTNLEVYAVPGSAAPSPQALKAVIYTDASGTPGTLVATGVEVTYRGNVNGTGWFELPFASSVHLAAGTYWIGFITGATSSGMGYAYDEAANARAYDENAFSAGPSEAFGTAKLDSESASIYATYVPGA